MPRKKSTAAKPPAEAPAPQPNPVAKTKADLTKLAAALAAAQRLNERPWATFKPTPTQHRFLQSTAPFRVLTSGNQGGKSYCVAHEIGLVLSDRHPTRKSVKGGNYLLMCLSRQQANLVWLPYLLGHGTTPTTSGDEGMIPHSEVNLKMSGKLDIGWDYAGGKPVPTYIAMKNGKRLYLAWHGVESSWKRIQGPQFQGVWLDESGDDTSRLMSEIIPRLWVPRSKEPTSGFCAWAATATTLNDAFDLWCERGQDEEFKDYEYFWINPLENPAISQEIRDSARNDLSAEEYAIRVTGEASRSDSLLVLPMLDEKRHIAPEPYVMAPDDNIYVVYDPGVRDNTGILFLTVSRQSKLRLNLVQYFELHGMTIPQEVDIMRQWLNGRRLTGFIYDRQGCLKTERGVGKSILHQVQDAMDNGRNWFMRDQPYWIAPAGQVDAQVKNTWKYLEPPPQVYHEPMVRLDPFNDAIGNGMSTFWRHLRRTRVRENAIRKKKLLGSDIVDKNQEPFDLLRYACTVAPSWRDLGLHGGNPMPARIIRPQDVTVEEAVQASEEEQRRAKAMARSAEIARMARRKPGTMGSIRYLIS